MSNVPRLAFFQTYFVSKRYMSVQLLAESVEYVSLWGREFQLNAPAARSGVLRCGLQLPSVLGGGAGCVSVGRAAPMPPGRK